MSALPPRAMPDDLALVRVLEASIEILKTENEILRRRLAAAETWAAQAVITKQLALAAPIAAPGPVATPDQPSGDAPTRSRTEPPAEPEPRRSLLRYWFGWKAAG